MDLSLPRKFSIGGAFTTNAASHTGSKIQSPQPTSFSSIFNVKGGDQTEDKGRKHEVCSCCAVSFVAFQQSHRQHAGSHHFNGKRF
jgi:hypothetical protein